MYRIEFVRLLEFENSIMINENVIDQVDENQKMNYVKVLHIENDRNLLLIHLNVLELYDQNYVHRE